ncbi:MAG: ATP-binding protein [Chlorobi bacterium]|nr:ATP-binding protein [Chlorobiota bacterium]
MLLPKRISITGPESTGKSLLTRQLADYYKTTYVDEYSREFLNDKHGYDFQDILSIARKQLQNENSLAGRTNGILFCDTDILVNKVWGAYVYNNQHKWIEEKFMEHEYGLYLLCYPDLEWEYDPLRENPENRDELFGIYERELMTAGFNFKIVKGKGNPRFRNAVKIVDDYLKPR